MPPGKIVQPWSIFLLSLTKNSIKTKKLKNPSEKSYVDEGTFSGLYYSLITFDRSSTFNPKLYSVLRSTYCGVVLQFLLKTCFKIKQR